MPSDSERGGTRETVYVSDTPKRMLGNLLIDGPDGQCSYMYAGIEERCQRDAVAHTFVERGGDSVRVEMCAEHAREDVPEPPTTKQQELVTDGGVDQPEAEVEQFLSDLGKGAGLVSAALTAFALVLHHAGREMFTQTGWKFGVEVGQGYLLLFLLVFATAGFIQLLSYHTILPPVVNERE